MCTVGGRRQSKILREKDRERERETLVQKCYDEIAEEYVRCYTGNFRRFRRTPWVSWNIVAFGIANLVDRMCFERFSCPQGSLTCFVCSAVLKEFEIFKYFFNRKRMEMLSKPKIPKSHRTVQEFRKMAKLVKQEHYLFHTSVQYWLWKFVSNRTYLYQNVFWQDTVLFYKTVSISVMFDIQLGEQWISCDQCFRGI